jgi:WD40 repeat protein
VKAGGICAACALGDAFGETGDYGFGSLGIIGGHELIEIIARGGMGIVYRARQSEPVREVALKALPGAALLSEEARQRFRIEAQAMATLEHPAILPVYELGEDSDTPFFTMKLATGGSLAQRLAHYQGKWREIAELTASIAEAVQFAHEHGVLHRDLKPGNILFDETGKPFVSDFGLAKIIGHEADLTRTIALMGTPNYMAPELTRGGKGAATTASDVWSLGILLYELLSGVLPFRGDNIATVLRQIEEDQPSQVPHAPRDLMVIANKALRKETRHRYTSAGELADDLKRWLRGEPIRARAVPLIEQAWLWARRKPAAAVLVVLLAGMLLAGGVQVWRENSRLAASLKQEQVQRRTSLLTEARLLRNSAAPGRRVAALEAIQKSIPLGVGQDTRDEAAACLSMVDLKLLRTVEMSGLSRTPSRYGTFSPDLSLCAWQRLPKTGSAQTWCLSDTHTGKVVRTFAYEGGRERINLWFQFSPDGKQIAVREDSRTEIWSLEGTPTAPIEIIPAGESRDGDFLFLPDGGWMFPDGEGAIIRKQPGMPASTFQKSSGHRLAFDPITRQIASYGAGGDLKCWNLDDGKQSFSRMLVGSQLFLWHPFGGEILADDKGRICSLLTPGGSLSPADEARWKNMLGGNRLAMTQSFVGLRIPRDMKMMLDPRGRFLALMDRGRLSLLDSLNAEPILTQEGLSDDCLQISQDGGQLVVALGNRHLAFYEIVSSRAWKEYPRAPGIAFSADQSSAYELTLSPDGELAILQIGSGLRAWNIKMGQSPKLVLPVAAGEIVYDTPCFDQDTGDLLTLELKNDFDTPESFETRTPAHLIRLSRDRLTGDSSPITPTDKDQTTFDDAVAQVIAHESTWIVHDDGIEIGLTKLFKREYLLERKRQRPATWTAWPHGDRSKAVELVKLPASVQPRIARASEDGRYFVVREDNLKTNSQDVKVYAFGKPAAPLATLPGASGAQFFRFSPDSRWLLVRTTNETLLFAIQGQTFTLAQTLPPCPSGKICFSGDSKTLALSGNDGAILLLNGPDLNQSLRLLPPRAVSCFVLNHDGSRLFLGGDRGRVYEWNIAGFRQELKGMGVAP